MTPFPIVTSKDEVIDNIDSFTEALNRARHAEDDSHATELIGRLATYRRWYAVRNPLVRYGANRWLFGPSIWVGYKGMDAGTHRFRGIGEADLHGWDTEGVLSRWFRPVAPGDPEHADVQGCLSEWLQGFGKRPRKNCTISIVGTEGREAAEAAAAAEAKQHADVAALLIRVARGLPPFQRARIVKALSK